MSFGDNEEGRLAGAGGAGHGDGDPGGHHGFKQSCRGRVEGAQADQVAELEAPPREGPDSDHRTVGGDRWQHRVEPLAAREAGVDPGPRLVHAQPEGCHHPLHHGGNGRRRGEPHGGALDTAATLHPDVGGAVDQDVGDGRVRQQRCERTEAAQLVADGAHDRRRCGLGQEDPVVAQRLPDRRAEAAAGRPSGRSHASRPTSHASRPTREAVAVPRQVTEIVLVP